jgi:hypothetical protein
MSLSSGYRANQLAENTCVQTMTTVTPASDLNQLRGSCEEPVLAASKEEEELKKRWSLWLAICCLSTVFSMYSRSTSATTTIFVAEADSTMCSCDDRTTFTAWTDGATQTLCSINALTINVTNPGLYRICYTIFGGYDARLTSNDGVNAWVTGPSTNPYIAYTALPPRALGPLYDDTTLTGTTSVQNCQLVKVSSPFTATVQFAYFENAPEKWGCQPPKEQTPSYLQVEQIQ